VAPRLKKILITAGPTREMLDPVRFLSNLSTGEMGYALAKVAVSKGYQVSLVSGPTDLQPPKGVKFYAVTSALQMKKVCAELFPKHDGLIMTAAVCDFMPAVAGRHKIPSVKGLTLQLKRTPDILASLAKQKGRRVVIGFCLETQDLIRRAQEKLKRKKLDGIVANFFGSGRIPFGKRSVEVHLIDARGKVVKIGSRSKAKIAKGLLKWMETLDKDPSKNLF
jgi:phosphopantothenoylcysteine decarboxylase / phosphopantothenate---cysteine ligase